MKKRLFEDSSTKTSTSGLPERDTTNAAGTSSKEVPVRRAKSPGRPTSHQPTTSSELGRLLSRKRQGEPSTRGHSQRKRHRQTASPPTAGQVGERHTTVQTTGLTRLGRLIEEARDPPVIIVKGSSNQLKCWRFRFQHKCGHLYNTCSSVFKWIDDTNNAGSRMLIAFSSTKQRQQFINCVKFPRGTSYSFGALNSL
ncbi:E8/E2 protein [Human papillomavirus type 219]|uniref:Protein E8^E2C n=1 Tax=Human papillomavirus type 219 TaxID=2200956 RepID=A0A2S1ZRW1_9PAPI|nr:E8/E2 protein [Human papillomavirus type 219]